MTIESKSAKGRFEMRQRLEKQVSTAKAVEQATLRRAGKDAALVVLGAAAAVFSPVTVFPGLIVTAKSMENLIKRSLPNVGRASEALEHSQHRLSQLNKRREK